MGPPALSSGKSPPLIVGREAEEGAAEAETEEEAVPLSPTISPLTRTAFACGGAGAVEEVEDTGACDVAAEAGTAAAAAATLLWELL